MTNISLPQEDDFKRWVREVLREELNQSSLPAARQAPEETLLSRQQIAAELGISLVTLTDWMKKGLPYLRLNGRVYFKRTEVIASMKHNALKKYERQYPFLSGSPADRLGGIPRSAGLPSPKNTRGRSLVSVPLPARKTASFKVNKRLISGTTTEKGGW